MRIALIGYMGSGKSTVGRLLAEQMNLPFIDLDKLIESHEQMSVADIFRKRDEAYFRQLESKMLKEILNLENDFVLATGGGTPCFFDHMNLLNERSVTVYLRCSSEVIESRLKETYEDRPILSTLTAGVGQHMKERANTYDQARIIVNGELPAHELSVYIQRSLE